MSRTLCARTIDSRVRYGADACRFAPLTPGPSPSNKLEGEGSQSGKEKACPAIYFGSFVDG